MSEQCSNDDVGSDCEWWNDGDCGQVETCEEARKTEPLKPGEHTPGPWEVTRHHKKDGLCPAHYKIDQVGEMYSHVLVLSAKDGGEGEANARLIAAAPELLEACTRAHDALLSLHVCNQDNSFAAEIRTLLKAAITKATQ